jgi:hypothetical protein
MLIEWVIKVSQVFNHNPLGSWLLRMAKMQMVELCTDTNNCKIKIWKEKLTKRADLEKPIKEVKVRIGL